MAPKPTLTKAARNRAIRTVLDDLRKRYAKSSPRLQRAALLERMEWLAEVHGISLATIRRVDQQGRR